MNDEKFSFSNPNYVNVVNKKKKKNWNHHKNKDDLLINWTNFV